MIGKKIQTKFLNLIIALIGLFVISSLSLIYINHKHTELLHSESLKQFDVTISNSLQSKSSTLEFTVKDFTFWDDMVNYARKPDTIWYRDNIELSIVQPLKLSNVWVFNSDFRNIKTENNDSSLSYFISKSFFKELQLKKYLHFYHYSDSTITEYIAASIHPSNDPGRKTDPAGYLIVSKNWTQAYINELELLSGCKIMVAKINNSGICRNINHNLVISKDFASWDYTIESSMIFIRSDDKASLIESFTYKLISLFLITGIAFLISVYYFFKKWINIPLKIVSETLENEDNSKLDYLKQSSSEFKEIAILFEKFIKQKSELNRAKLKAEESDKLKSAFLSNISHEVRTPMNAIVGFATLLKINEQNDMERVKEYADIIHSNSNMLLEVFGDILDIARVESNQLELNHHKFSITDLIDELQKNFKERANAKLLEFIFEPEFTHSEYYIFSDAGRLRQVISNLLNNALKFTNKGCITLGYRTKENNITIFVRDTGIGISNDERQSIFEPFRQIETILSKRYPGTGLGLSLAKSITTLLGGNLTFESEPGSGSTFYVTFPLDISSNISNYNSTNS